MALPLFGERRPRQFLLTPSRESEPAFSPDGRWIAYRSDESGRLEIYVTPYPGPGGRWQISTQGGTEAVWARDGRELFYRSGDKMMSVAVDAGREFRAGTPRLLFEGRYHDTYDVAPDGQRFLMIAESERDLGETRLQVVLGWFGDLRRRVPSGKS